MHPDIERARSLVLRFGHNPTAYQTLNPGHRYWFSPRHEAFAAFVRRARTWVIAGGPICADADLPAVLPDLEQAARLDRCSVCYANATDRLRDVLASSPDHSLIHLGAQPVWNPARWSSAVAGNRAIRSQLNRARNKSITITAVPSHTARTDPQLQTVLDAWIGSRPLPPMHFLNEANPLAGPLEDRLLFVASLPNSTPIAFLLASPVTLRNGHLVELLARSPTLAPNGTAELLIDHAMRTLADSGFTFLTMGLVPLTPRAPLHTNPFWLRLVFSWARAHGRRFYHFDGLETFRTKLSPDHWEPLYAICNRPRFRPQTLYALSSAFFDTSPITFLIQAATRAIKEEFRRFSSRH